jgi:hypothetical protein
MSQAQDTYPESSSLAAACIKEVFSTVIPKHGFRSSRKIPDTPIVALNPIVIAVVSSAASELHHVFVGSQLSGVESHPFAGW